MFQTVRWVHGRFGMWAAIGAAVVLLLISTINAIGTVDTALEIADGNKPHWVRTVAAEVLARMGPLHVTPDVNLWIGVSGLVLVAVAIVLALRGPAPPCSSGPPKSKSDADAPADGGVVGSVPAHGPGDPILFTWARDNCSSVGRKPNAKEIQGLGCPE